MTPKIRNNSTLLIIYMSTRNEFVQALNNWTTVLGPCVFIFKVDLRSIVLQHCCQDLFWCGLKWKKEEVWVLDQCLQASWGRLAIDSSYLQNQSLTLLIGGKLVCRCKAGGHEEHLWKSANFHSPPTSPKVLTLARPLSSVPGYTSAPRLCMGWTRRAEQVPHSSNGPTCYLPRHYEWNEIS